jgi:hypothetical protein
MTEEKRTAVLQELRNGLAQEMGYEVKLETVSGRELLRFTAPLFENDTGYVLIEICQLDYDENFELFQIYSTMIPEPGPGLAELRKAVNRWNLTAALGAYGIYDPLGQLFHKYNVIVGVEDTPDMVVGQVLAALYITMDEMERRLADAVALSSGTRKASDLTQ